jgi:serine/threonine-protein kinase/endoribonuclease IRE1
LRSFYAAFALAAAAASVGDTDPRDWDPPLSSASSSSLSTDVRHSRVRQDSSSSSEVGADERELLDVVLVASIDGKFHALNRASGHVLWSMSAPHASTPPAPELGPLVRTAHPEIDPDLHDGQEQYIIEPQSGDIYVLADPAGPLQRLPFSMSRLVDIAPHHSQEGGVERMFVGKKETSLLVIELETGRLLRTINADAACPWERPLDESRFREVDLDDLEDSESIPPSSTHIYIGRTGTESLTFLCISAPNRSFMQITMFPFIHHPHLAHHTNRPYKTYFTLSMDLITRTCPPKQPTPALRTTTTSNPSLVATLSA